MTHARILVTGRTDHELGDALARAIAVREAGRHDLDRVEVVVLTRRSPRRGGALAAALARTDGVEVRRAHALDDAGLLDLGLFPRPLPTAVAVVGDETPWALDMALIISLLADAGVGAVVPVGASDGHLRSLLRHGGVFAAGPLCVAGGFAGDGRTPVSQRLDHLGYATLELPPVASRDARRHPAVDRHMAGASA